MFIHHYVLSALDLEKFYMVRSISEETGTPMPSFFGYIIKYSVVFLIPTFVIVTFVFFLKNLIYLEWFP